MKRMIKKIISKVTIYTSKNLFDYFGKFKAIKYKETVYEYNIARSDKVCVFASFTKHHSNSIEMQLKNLASNGFAIIYVSNVEPNSELMASIEKYCRVRIARSNYGRDFGMYKTGFEYLRKMDFLSAKSLLFINDTIIYPLFSTSNFDNALEKLNADVVGPFESCAPTLHLQSFYILCKNEIFKTKNFIAFWENYSNSESRVKVIERGELGFSKHLVKENIRFKGIVSFDSLANLSVMENLDMLPGGTPKKILKTINYLGDALPECNPSHFLAKLAVKKFDIPMIKRDLLFRKSLMVGEVHQLLNGLSSEQLDDVIYEYKKKGLSRDGGAWRYFLEKVGQL